MAEVNKGHYVCSKSCGKTYPKITSKICCGESLKWHCDLCDKDTSFNKRSEHYLSHHSMSGEKRPRPNTTSGHSITNDRLTNESTLKLIQHLPANVQSHYSNTASWVPQVLSVKPVATEDKTRVDLKLHVTHTTLCPVVYCYSSAEEQNPLGHCVFMGRFPSSVDKDQNKVWLWVQLDNPQAAESFWVEVRNADHLTPSKRLEVKLGSSPSVDDEPQIDQFSDCVSSWTQDAGATACFQGDIITLADHLLYGLNDDEQESAKFLTIAVIGHHQPAATVALIYRLYILGVEVDYDEVVKLLLKVNSGELRTAKEIGDTFSSKVSLDLQKILDNFVAGVSTSLTSSATAQSATPTASPSTPPPAPSDTPAPAPAPSDTPAASPTTTPAPSATSVASQNSAPTTTPAASADSSTRSNASPTSSSASMQSPPSPQTATISSTQGNGGQESPNQSPSKRKASAGCCGGAPPDQALAQQKARSDQIDAELSKVRKVFCLIMLGTGGSGKSTLFKQIKILNDLKFSDEEKSVFKETIRKNLVMAAHFVLASVPALQDSENTKKVYEYVAISTEYLRQGREALQVETQFLDAVKELCKDKVFQEAVASRKDMWQHDGANYFLKHVDRIVASDFVPTKEDILRSRRKTTEVSEVSFKTTTGVVFNVCDIGGQRSERRKWYRLFMRDITAIIYVTAISEFDEALGEDAMTNRIHESLSVFESLLQQTKDTPTVLFLNKVDLFDEKIKRGADMAVGFPNYKGEDPRAFVQRQFLLRNKSETRPIFPHLTCALDTDNIRTVMQNVQAICIGNAIKASGL